MISNVEDVHESTQTWRVREQTNLGKLAGVSGVKTVIKSASPAPSAGSCTRYTEEELTVLSAHEAGHLKQRILFESPATLKQAKQQLSIIKAEISRLNDEHKAALEADWEECRTKFRRTCYRNMDYSMRGYECAEVFDVQPGDIRPIRELRKLKGMFTASGFEPPMETLINELSEVKGIDLGSVGVARVGKIQVLLTQIGDYAGVEGSSESMKRPLIIPYGRFDGCVVRFVLSYQVYDYDKGWTEYVLKRIERRARLREATRDLRKRADRCYSLMREACFGSSHPMLTYTEGGTVANLENHREAGLISLADAETCGFKGDHSSYAPSRALNDRALLGFRWNGSVTVLAKEDCVSIMQTPLPQFQCSVQLPLSRPQSVEDWNRDASIHADNLERELKRKFDGQTIVRVDGASFYAGLRPLRTESLSSSTSVKVEVAGSGPFLVGTEARGDAIDDQSLFQAAAELKTLSNARDVRFQLYRSIGELKDLPKSWTTGKDFLLFCCRDLPRMGKDGAMALLAKLPDQIRGYKAIIGMWLAWKFAIKPTIDDINTVRSNTIEYLSEIRKTLSETVEKSLGSTSVLHFRRRIPGYESDKLIRGQDGSVDYVDFPSALRWADKVEVAFDTSITCKPTCHIARHVDQGSGRADVVHRTREVSSVTVTNVGEDSGERAYRTIVQLDRFPEIRVANAELGIQYVVPKGDKYSYTTVAVAGRHGTTGINEIYAVGERPSYSEEVYRQKLSKVLQLVDSETPQGSLRVELPVIAKNEVELTSYASFWLADLFGFLTDYNSELGQSLLSPEGGLSSTITGWARTASVIAETLWSKLDAVFTTWELTPLSFVYDWFTTSGTLSRALNALARGVHADAAPQPREGVWACRRVELYTGYPLYGVTSRAECYYTDWAYHAFCYPEFGGNAPTPITGCRASVMAAPTRCVLRRVVSFAREEGLKVPLRRSGLYRVRRGEFGVSSSEWASLLTPRIQIKLDTDKINTLFALVAQIINPGEIK